MPHHCTLKDKGAQTICAGGELAPKSKTPRPFQKFFPSPSSNFPTTTIHKNIPRNRPRLSLFSSRRASDLEFFLQFFDYIARFQGSPCETTGSLFFDEKNPPLSRFPLSRSQGKP